MTFATVGRGGQRDSTAFFLLQCGLYVAVIACLTALFLFIRHFDQALSQTLRNASQTIAGVQTTQTKLNAALDALNRPCVRGNCGLIPGAEFDEHEALVAVGQVEIMANLEKHNLAAQLAQEKAIAAETEKAIADVDKTVVGVNKTVGGVNKTVAGLEPAEAQLIQEETELETATRSLNALISNPDIPETVAYLKTTAAESAQTMQHVTGTTADVQQAVHSYLHPTWPVKIWHAIANTGVEVAKFFW